MCYYKSLFLTKQIIAHTDFCNKPVPIMEKAINVFRKFDKAIIDKNRPDNQETTEDVIKAYQGDIRGRFH